VKQLLGKLFKLSAAQCLDFDLVLIGWQPNTQVWRLLARLADSFNVQACARTIRGNPQLESGIKECIFLTEPVEQLAIDHAVSGSGVDPNLKERFDDRRPAHVQRERSPQALRGLA